MSAGVSLKTVSLHCVVAIASAAPGGLTAAALAKRAAISPGRVKNLLTFAFKARLLGKVQDGRNTLWIAPQAVETARRAIQQQREQPRWQRGHDLSDAPVQRRVPVDAPLPFVCRAPASVFAWRPA